MFLFCIFFCLLCLCARLFVCAWWSPAGKELNGYLVTNCRKCPNILDRLKNMAARG